jgi:cytochrome c-type biogenesis protein CcmH/NrfG
MHYQMKRRIPLLGLILSASLYWGVPEAVFSHTSVREELMQNVKTGQKLSLKVPQGQGFVAEEKQEQARPEEEKKPLPETPRPKAEPKRKGWPLKRFVPSEKIPADQAVDFPADI